MKRILLGVIGLLCLCVACQRKDLSFKPGEVWLDDKGVHITLMVAVFYGSGILIIGLVSIKRRARLEIWLK